MTINAKTCEINLLYCRPMHRVFYLCILTAFASKGLSHNEYNALKTIRVNGCLEEAIEIECPESTTINISEVRSVRSSILRGLCPPTNNSSKEALRMSLTASLHYSSRSDCIFARAKKKLNAVCEFKKYCRIKMSASLFESDACRLNESIEVSYKCTPNKISSKTVCKGDKVHLRCIKDSFIVIYSTVSVPFDLCSHKEPNLHANNKKTCNIYNATDIFMSHCHRRKQCTFIFDKTLFGHQSTCCLSNVRLFYSCSAKEIIKDNLAAELRSLRVNYESRVQRKAAHLSMAADANNKNDVQMINESMAIAVQRNAENESRSSDEEDGKQANIACNCTIVVRSDSTSGFVIEWISAVTFIRANTERLILYLLVSFLGALLTVFLVVSCRLCLQKRRAINKLRREAVRVCSPIHSITADENREIDSITNILPASSATNVKRFHGNGYAAPDSYHNRRHSYQTPLTSEDEITLIVPTSRANRIRNQNTRSYTHPRSASSVNN